MNQKKAFSTPDEVLFGKFNKAQLSAIRFVEDKLNANDFNFKPPYQVGQYATPLISDLLRDSGWNLSVNGNGDWSITPMI